MAVAVAAKVQRRCRRIQANGGLAANEFCPLLLEFSHLRSQADPTAVKGILDVVQLFLAERRFKQTDIHGRSFRLMHL
jgi:hypothetical protein